MNYSIEHISGWNSKLFEGLKDWAIIKFGANPKKKSNDHTSWSPTADPLANRLLNRIVGANYYNTPIQSLRVLNRALWIKELISYLSTDKCDVPFIEYLAKEDIHWYYGKMHAYDGDSKMLLLTA